MAQERRKISVKFLFRLRSIFKDLSASIRVVYYKMLGATIGVQVKMGTVKMSVPEQVIIGNECELEDNVRLRVGGSWKSSSIIIGDESFVGHSTQINVGGHFKIGKQCLIAPMCIFSDAHHSFDDIDLPIRQQKCLYNPITIEDNVWIGTGVRVLGGVTIHTGSVIASGAVVTRTVPAYEVWGGIPARKLKSRIQ